MVASEYEIETRVRDMRIEADRIRLERRAARVRGERLATGGLRFHLARWVSRRLFRAEPCGGQVVQQEST